MSEQNLLGTNFCVRKRQAKLTKIAYSKFSLFRISCYPGFGLDRFHCTYICRWQLYHFRTFGIYLNFTLIDNIIFSKFRNIKTPLHWRVIIWRTNPIPNTLVGLRNYLTKKWGLLKKTSIEYFFLWKCQNHEVFIKNRRSKQ
jgi:hypothetical protein